MKRKNEQVQLVPVTAAPMTNAAFANHARTVVAHHGERILAEVPTTLKRIGQLFFVLSLTIPAFCVGLLFVLWHLAR